MTTYRGVICKTEIVIPDARHAYKATLCPDCDTVHGFRRVEEGAQA